VIGRSSSGLLLGVKPVYDEVMAVDDFWEA
jgi:hypothetical protein